MLLAAFAFWNGSGGLNLADVIALLDLAAAEPLCTLVVAVKQGSSAVDAWLSEREPKLHTVRCRTESDPEACTFSGIMSNKFE
jgi:hypothetical protein